MHIFTKNLSPLREKLDNFDFGIIKKVAPRNLDKAEDFSFLTPDRIFWASISTKFVTRFLFARP